MKRTISHNPFVAKEGLPFLFGTAAIVAAVWQYVGFWASLLPFVAFIYFYLLFRDPHRPVPAVPLGVVSPVDGEVLDVSVTDHSVLGGEAHTIRIKVDSLGTYTARSPVEGKVMDLATDGVKGRSAIGSGGLWVRTDETDDVVLRFSGNRFGLAPRAFVRYGERLGQGQRCAFLRLTRVAEVQVPIVARIQVEKGQAVTAGSDVIAKLPHH